MDADELLVYSGMQAHPLDALCRQLEAQGRQGLGALMLDLYPKGPLGAQAYAPGQDPCEVLQWFDAGPYRAARQQPAGNLWVQGGARERVFFADRPERSPTLNKIPLLRWNRALCLPEFNPFPAAAAGQCALFWAGRLRAFGGAAAYKVPAGNHR